MVIKHTAEFDLTYRFITETNQNVFLTGKAGTGKTTLLKYLREKTLKECIVAAPTGVAAINARGVTLHSLFQLPFGIIIPSSVHFNSTRIKHHPLLSKLHYTNEKIDLLRRLELLIIDEASMVASYIVDAIDTILRYIRKNPHRPFGGVQVLFVGDLYQLPPVVRREEWEILQDYYSSIFFFDSTVFRDNPPVIIELKEIFRQKDSEFIEILNGIRDNNLTEENFKTLQSRIKKNFVPPDEDEFILLTTHNQQADKINNEKLARLNSKTFSFTAEVIDDFPDKTFPAERELELKVGAQVMFLRNDIENKKYFNGKIGTVTKLNAGTIMVKCKDDNNEIEVKKSEWENIRYRLDRETNEITEEILGRFIQYPLRLAWAITIHKSQGLTFDKVVVDAQRAFATGQVYVALSRCTALEGLVLTASINRYFLGGHPDFMHWQQNNYNGNLPQQLIESRRNYILDELNSIFTWSGLEYALVELKGILEENKDKIDGTSFEWLARMIEGQNELNELSDEFKNKILQLAKLGLSVEENEELQKRIKEGSIYFFTKLSRWKQDFLQHPMNIESKKLSLTIDAQLISIQHLLFEILKKIKLCRNGFVLDEYLHHSTVSFTREKEIHSSYNAKKRNTVEESIRLFREFRDVSITAAERGLTLETIEGHLAKGIRQGLIDIQELLPAEEVDEISGYFPVDLTNIKLRSIKDIAPPDVSFGQLKIVLALLQKRAEESFVKSDQ